MYWNTFLNRYVLFRKFYEHVTSLFQVLIIIILNVLITMRGRGCHINGIRAVRSNRTFEYVSFMFYVYSNVIV